MSNLRVLNKFKKNSKAISPLIATLLLIAIAVAASVLTYSWVMSMIGTQSTQAQTQVRVDSIAWNLTAQKLTVVVRNTGSVAASIDSVALSLSASGSTYYSVTYTSSNSINTGQTTTFVWTGTGASAPANFLKPLTQYNLRIITTTGFQYAEVDTTPSS